MDIFRRKSKWANRQHNEKRMIDNFRLNKKHHSTWKRTNAPLYISDQDYDYYDAGFQEELILLYVNIVSSVFFVISFATLEPFKCIHMDKAELI